jgi:hypothetical protein
VPDIPVLTLNTYEEDGTLQVALGALAAGPGQGTWTRLDDTHFTARFKFLIFDVATGRRTGSEELTKDIRVTGPDAFDATTTFDLFDAAGTTTATGCLITETATRFKVISGKYLTVLK